MIFNIKLVNLDKKGYRVVFYQAYGPNLGTRDTLFYRNSFNIMFEPLNFILYTS